MRNSAAQNRSIAVLVLICPTSNAIRTKIPRGVAGTTKTASRRRGLGRNFQMRASYSLIFKKIKLFRAFSYNGGLSDPHTHTKRPTARGGNKPRRFRSLLYHFLAFASARACFGSLSSSVPISFFFLDAPSS
jgi:hypothetical protein